MNFLTPTLIGVLLIALILLVYWTLVFVILYHLVRFGIGTQPKKIAFVFFVGAIGLFFLSVMVFAQIDFSTLTEQIKGLMGGFLNPTYL